MAEILKEAVDVTEEVESDSDNVKNMVGPINRVENSTSGEALSSISENIDIEIEIEDGADVEGMGIDINLNEETAGLMAAQSDHYVNLAEFIDDEDLVEIGSIVIEQFTADRDSREEWESTFERGFDLLGLKLEEASEPFEGACQAVSPLIIESAVKFQSKATIELFPAMGPVKTQIVGNVNPEKEQQANRVQNYMNYQLTEQMPEFFDEFERMLFHLPLVGSAFKKIYYDAAKERPCSEFVPVDQFYASYYASDLRSADRYTHIIYRSPNDLRREMAAGMYQEIQLEDASVPEATAIADKINTIMGVSPSSDHDPQYVLLEQHCYIDLPEPFESDNGVARPYIVTVEEESQKVLSIRRNWAEGDPTYSKLMYFSHYKFVPGFGFYGLGLIHLLGNLTMSATAALRSLVDSGQFANLPGGFKARGVRTVGGNDPIAPGEFREIDATGMDLNKAIVHLPYREPSQTLYKLLETMTEMGHKFADTTEQVVNDSTNYGPVGTTLALLEASAKFFSAIHKRLHHSQKEELRILSRINKDFLPDEYPYELPGISSTIKKTDFDGRIDVIPVSDPNTPSSSHRLAMAQMTLQLSQQAPPGMYDIRQVHMSVLHAANIQNPQRFIIPEQEPKPQDPITDIKTVVNNKPIKAFPAQDHKAHIAIKEAFIQDPMLGQSEPMKNVVPVLEANIREHMIMQYEEQIAGLVRIGGQQMMQGAGNQQQMMQGDGNQQQMMQGDGNPQQMMQGAGNPQQMMQGNPQQQAMADPAVVNQLTTEAAKEILQFNKQQAAMRGGAESVEQQSLMLEAEKINISKDELRMQSAKDAAEIALENRKLDLEEKGIDQKIVTETTKTEERNTDRRLKALKDAATIAGKAEADESKEINKVNIEAMKNMMKVAELELKENPQTKSKNEEIVTSEEPIGMQEGGVVPDIDAVMGERPTGRLDVSHIGPRPKDEEFIIESDTVAELGIGSDEPSIVDTQTVDESTINMPPDELLDPEAEVEEVEDEETIIDSSVVNEIKKENEKLDKSKIIDIAAKQILPYEVSSKDVYNNKYADRIYKDGDKKAIGIAHNIKPNTVSLLEKALGITKKKAQKIIKEDGLSWTDANKLFRYELINYRNSAASLVNNFTDLSPNLQAGLINLHYRGDLKKSSKLSEKFKFVELIEAGNFQEAAVELLDHKEYLERKKKKPKGDSITKRLEFVAELLKKEV